jgi:hypothetical protein
MPFQEIETVLFAIFMVKFEIFSLKLGHLATGERKAVNQPLTVTNACRGYYGFPDFPPCGEQKNI